MKQSTVKKAVGLVLAVVIAATSLSGCGKSKSEDSAPKEASGVQSSGAVRDVLNFGILQEPATLDPVISTERITYLPEGCIYDTLLERDQENNLLPKLAESWEVSDDGLTYTLKIRNDVKFHNGDPLTVDDVVFTIGKLTEAQASNFSVIDTVEAVDDSTVKFTLKYAYGPVLFFFTLPQTGIVNKALYEKDAEGYARNPVGTGPFKFDNWVSGSSVTLTRNDEYWREPAKMKTINFVVIPEESTGLVALESGELDAFLQISLSNAPLMEANDNLVWYLVPGAQVNVLSFNMGDHPDGKPSVFKDNLALRQAICYAINKDEVAFACTEGINGAVQTPYMEAVNNYPEGFTSIPYDPEMAKQKLAEAGYPNGFTFKARTVVQPLYAKAAEIIQGQLSKVGITMELETMERGTFLQEVTKNSDFDMTIWAIVCDIPDADHGMYKRFHSDNIGKSNMNYMQVNNPELDELIMTNRMSSDDKVKAEAVRKMTEIVNDEAYAMGLYSTPWTLAYNKNLTGVFMNSSMAIDFYPWAWTK